ncbi:MAG: AAA family ATPase [Candidatus Sulfotelmatobacter sp.]
MFLDFYGLREQPFGVTPDPRFLYLSPAHREALASMFYGIDAERGFVALIAKPGMGKTTLLFQLLQKFQSRARTAFVFQTQCTSREFMRFLLLELGCEVSREQDLVTMHEQFNRCLLQEAQAGRRFIVVVDEAQNLEASVLETIRLLSDFETLQAKLLQIVLSGQPELADKLARPSLRQLRQRVSLLTTLAPLSPEEVARYINHRLRAAGRPDGPLFTAPAAKMISELSEGIPRNINNICFNALSLGCALRQKTIDVGVIQQVAADFDLASLGSEPGTSTFEPETISFSAVSEARSLVAKSISTPLKTRSGEPLNPEDALAYMQEIIRRLKNNQYFAN